MSNVRAANEIIDKVSQHVPASIRQDVHRAVVAWLDMIQVAPNDDSEESLMFIEAMRAMLAVCVTTCYVDIDEPTEISDMRQQMCRALRLMAHAIDAAAQRSTGGP
jgi:hypothetical protein